MKKLLIILIVTGISLGASSQKRYYVQRSYPRSHVAISVGTPIYPYYGYYDPFYSPVYRYGYFPGESKLDLRIEDIRADYQDKIWSAKHDESLGKTERKRVIHNLKNERDEAIIRARRDYYKSY